VGCPNRSACRRRTYISITLLANGFDVKWVMSQVGHADSKMTLDVYAQLEQRADRSHGTSFDALIQRAEDARRDAEIGNERFTAPRRARNRLENASRKRIRRGRKSREFKEMARPGLEPGTPRFSGDDRVGCSMRNALQSAAFMNGVWSTLNRRSLRPLSP
jgi:hypothetical protein